ncbi:hypothetical protein F4820DRAFT_401230 [Hypoxylon rubiginosum]|uniref:Uncharacterized protein n=1 Tax=Hypoxylon rubiginosum TaxID=110542 RepID=A0ACB9ZIP1_9PEZI|nr:hypothetical protein F4820DRAFT_401230 [Hypoxylon rubiginosum]
MAPQTRSRGRPSTSAPASEPKSEPAKVYKSTAAAPKQKVFPARSRQLRTYGARNRKVRKDSQQGTLTQIGFVTQSTREVREKEALVLSDEEDENEDHVKEPEAPAPVKQANSKKRGRGSRRKTTGDELVTDEKPKNAKRRKTLGDAPTSTASSSFHTQTLTQFVRKDNNDDEMFRQINDSEGEDDAGFVMETPKKPKDNASLKIDESKLEPPAEVGSSAPSLIPSVTPTNRRTVIPSSTSPPTPLLRFNSPAPHNSPLASRSTNLGAPSPILKKVKTPKNQEIPNSYSTTHSLPNTPTPKAAVQKKTRFDVPEDTESITEEKENITPGNRKPKFPKPVRKTPARPALRPLGEVADTDDETVGDDDETVGDEDEEITNEVAIIETQNAPIDPQNDIIPSTDDPEPAETCYGAIGEETQALISTSADELNLELSTSDSRDSSPSREGTPTPKQKKKRRGISRATGVPTTPTPTSNPAIPVSSPQQDPSDETVATTHTQVYTQGLESQRLPLEVIRNLGPQTQHSDIILPLHPEPLRDILSRAKNHEFRSWKIPPGVCRIWIYGTKPFQELRYMVILSDLKIPGEIEDEDGIGNVEFNQGTGAAYAYEILQVYELNNPVSLVQMKQKGWFKAAPQKFAWLPPAVVGELTANLKCALFGDEATESQEIIAQIHSDVQYSTQHHSPENMDEVIPSSQSPRRSIGKGTQPRISSSFAKPAVPQPQQQPGSSVPSLAAPPAVATAPPSQRTRSFVRASQATTVSSPAVSPQKSLRATINISSDPPGSNSGNPHNSSPTAYRRYARDNSLRSSQFLSRSQMLPDSLVNDEIQEPPPIIWDSADEQSD